MSGPLSILPKIYDKLFSLYKGAINGTNKIQLVDQDSQNINAINPLAVDGDAVYSKDVDINNSNIGDFSGSILDFFNSLYTINTAQSVGSGGSNPKSFTVTLYRPLTTVSIALSSQDQSISNVKLTLKTISGDTVKIIDYSLDNTKRKTQIFSTPQEFFTQIIVEFYTDDEVNINGLILLKSKYVGIDSIKGIIDINNTTKNLLLANESFIGEPTDTKNYGNILVSVYSDVTSIDDGLSIQFSSDKINWYWEDSYTIDPLEGKTFSVQTQAQFMRVVYINGGNDQGLFDLHTTLKPVYTKPSSHKIDKEISGQDDAELIKAVLTGKDENGIFQNVNTTINGDLKISDNSSGLSIAQGNVSGVSFVHKFGNAPDFDIVDAPVSIWDGAEDGVSWELMKYIYSTTANIDRISSSSASDTVNIQIQGLDSNYSLVTQIITLTGQTPAILTTPLLRIFRLINVGNVDLVGHVFCFVNVATTGGVPNTASNIRAIIQPGNNQTLMALYTIPAGKTGYIEKIWASNAGANKTSNYVVDIFIRPFGQVFQLKNRNAISDNGNSALDFTYNTPEVVTEKSDIEIRCSPTAGGLTGASISAGFDLVLKNN